MCVMQDSTAPQSARESLTRGFHTVCINFAHKNTNSLFVRLRHPTRAFGVSPACGEHLNAISTTGVSGAALLWQERIGGLGLFQRRAESPQNKSRISVSF